MTASELRVNIANNQRMKKTRDKWLGFAKKLNSVNCWSDKTELNGQKIGDKVNFVVVYRGELVKSYLERNVNDLRELL